jgi:non-ribosomal peptide synthetase component F
MPFIDATFVYQNVPANNLAFAGCTVKPIPLHYRTSHDELMLEIFPETDGLRIAWSYRLASFEPRTIGLMAGRFATLLQSALAAPERGICELGLLTGEERRVILEQWSGRGSARAEHAVCVHEAFSRKAKERPHAPAIVDGRRTITYAELDAQSDAVANALCRRGVAPDERVALALPRSAELAAAALGVLKAGGVYLPIDAADPEARVARLVADANVRVAVSSRRLCRKLPEHVEVLPVEEIAERGEPPPRIARTPGDAVYVMYTSGSTGRPKGVIAPHTGIMRLVAGAKYLELRPPVARELRRRHLRAVGRAAERGEDGSRGGDSAQRLQDSRLHRRASHHRDDADRESLQCHRGRGCIVPAGVAHTAGGG